MNDSPEEELFESLTDVGKSMSAGSGDALQAVVLQKTLRSVRRRRRLRQFSFASVVLGAFVLGVLANRWWASTNAGAPPIADTMIPQPAPETIAGSNDEKKPPSADAKHETTVEIDDPWELRNQVIDAPYAEKISLLQKAGDIYLEENNVQLALHCYRQVVELTQPDQRQSVQPQDSWLLAEMKLDSVEFANNLIEVNR